uniref:EamA family transporter n=1 Tax=Sphingomonas bacterium TaxID=1895847 RepID=UPI0020C65A9C
MTDPLPSRAAPSRLAGLAPLAPVAPLVASMVSLCIGTSWAKTLFPVAGAAGMTALRVGLAALLLVAAQRPWRWRLTRDQAGAVAAYGVVLACMNLSFYACVRRLPLGIAIAIEFLGPLGVALIHSRRRLDLAWIALAGGGIALLVAPRAGLAPLDPAGVGFGLSAGLFWGLYIVTGKRASALVPSHRIVCLGLCVASLVAVPAGVAAAGVVLLRPDVLATGVGVALLCGVLPYSLEMIALKRLPAPVFGVVLSLEPAVGALAGLAVLGETLGGRQWAGIAAVVVASVGSTL